MGNTKQVLVKSYVYYVKEKVFKFIVVSFLVLFFVFAVCTLADTFFNHKMGVPSVSTGHFDSSGEFVEDSTVYPNVSFGAGDTMEKAEENAERNAVDLKR